MSKELYLHTLQQIRDGCLAENMDTEAEALEAAIQALSCEGDCILRQAAIDTLEKIPVREFKKTDDGLLDALISIGQVYRALKQLPSAQPEQQWIPCSECVNYIDERCVVANHHVSEKENCMEVFGAKRRTVERRRAWTK